MQPAKSFVMEPHSMVSMQTASRFSANVFRAVLLSSLALCRSPRVHAKMEAVENQKQKIKYTILLDRVPSSSPAVMLLRNNGTSLSSMLFALENILALLRKDIGYHEWHYTLSYGLKSPNQIQSSQHGDRACQMVTLISYWSLCGYIWVNKHTYHIRGPMQLVDSDTWTILNKKVTQTWDSHLPIGLVEVSLPAWWNL